MAELAFALMIAMPNHITKGDASMKKGEVTAPTGSESDAQEIGYHRRSLLHLEARMASGSPSGTKCSHAMRSLSATVR